MSLSIHLCDYILSILLVFAIASLAPKVPTDHSLQLMQTNMTTGLAQDNLTTSFPEQLAHMSFMADCIC